LSIVRKLYHKYFDKNLDLKVQVFNLLAIVGILSGIAGAALAALLRLHISIIIIIVAISAFSFLMLRIAEKKKNYHLCSWFQIVAVFFVIFPAVYLVGGGYYNGIGHLFLLSFVCTVFLLERYERIAALLFEVLLYAACYIVTYTMPGLSLIPITEQNHFVFSVLIFITTATILLLVLMMRNRLVSIKQREIVALNIELKNRNEELAQYDAMKNDFLNTVAHEINTPLAIITASSSDTLDLLKEEPLNIEDMIGNQEIIRQRVKLINSIMLDLIDTVAIERGSLKLNREPVNMVAQIENICNTQHKKLDMNNNSIELDLQTGLQPVWVDRLKIEQVLINLLSNAFRYTHEGIIKLKLEHSNGRQTVSVIDNGTGMDAEMARIVLRKYVSTKTDYWRHGIGLYICRQIITAHDGDIWIESEKGHGTTVSFSINEGTFV